MYKLDLIPPKWKGSNAFKIKTGLGRLDENWYFALLSLIMIPIKYPEDKVTTRAGKSGTEIFDPVRKKWVLMTPEEWVRQNFIAFMHFEKKYPLSLFSVEKEFFLGEMKKRADIVVYSRAMKPFVIVECKEMNTKLSMQVLEQALRYHLVLQPQYLLITNGVYCHGYSMKTGAFREIDFFPAFPD